MYISAFERWQNKEELRTWKGKESLHHEEKRLDILLRLVPHHYSKDQESVVIQSNKNWEQRCLVEGKGICVWQSIM